VAWWCFDVAMQYFEEIPGKRSGFAGGWLTFLKLVLTSAGFGGCVCNFFKATGSQILAFQPAA